MEAEDLTVGVHASVDQVFPPSELCDRLTGDGADVRVVEGDLAACDGLVTMAYDESFLGADLRWIHSIQAGVDRFPFDELEARGITLTNSTGIHGDAIGETVVGYALQFARRLHVYRDQQHRNEWAWPDWDAPFTLPGTELCVVGLGTLGQGIARRADAFGMDVVGVKRTPVPVEHVREVYTTDRLREAVGDARFVAVAVPLTDETERMIGAEELAAMREDAYLLNVSRGGVVDEDALLDALQAGDLAGAALDVSETEPLPADSAFWELENVIVTPHAAGATVNYVDRVADLVRENVRRVAAGKEYVNRVV
jgi:D-2-hydroxyacid dehydrogenase (NADP+)